jgi:hypothetical protein
MRTSATCSRCFSRHAALWGACSRCWTQATMMLLAALPVGIVIDGLLALR